MASAKKQPLFKKMNKAFNEVLKKIKKSPKILIIYIFLILVVAFCLISLNFRIHADSTGGNLGEGTGILAGRAIGSLEGLSKGQVEGYQAGKNEGLSAKDTTAEIATKIEEVEKLEVLIASGKYVDIQKIGPDQNKPDSAALLSMQYNAVFTVDLGNADISSHEDGLYILLDEPVVEFYPVGDIEVVDKYQKPSIIGETGTTVDGYTATVNTMNKMREEAQKKIQANTELMEAAKESAKKQLEELVQAVSLNKPNVNITFREG